MILLCVVCLCRSQFDASSDSDIPKYVPFTFVINTLIPPRSQPKRSLGGARSAYLVDVFEKRLLFLETVAASLAC